MSDLPAKPGVEVRRVARYAFYAVGDDGTVWTKLGTAGRRWDVLKSFPTDSGHLAVNLVPPAGGPKVREYVHVLVLEAFDGPRPFAGAEGRHLDDDKLNNNHSNLVWGTKSENNLDRERNRSRIE